MQNVPIVIVGPTSSGKTALSLQLATNLGNTDILVVDSKQVYTGQDIVTGKDLPLIEDARIFGVDLVAPNTEWSVAHFLAYARAVINDVREERRNLIIVGGTPQFTLSLFDNPNTVIVARDEQLRMELEQKSVADLQMILRNEDSLKFISMNESDQQNPRRLIRAIEVIRGKGKKEVLEHRYEALLEKESVQWIGLHVDRQDLQERIQKRVIRRLQEGAIGEYQKLFENYPDWTSEAKAAIGYEEIALFLTQKISQQELIDLWTLHEMQYAKRQMQWWKREQQIQWFDALSADLNSTVFKFLKLATMNS